MAWCIHIMCTPVCVWGGDGGGGGGGGGGAREGGRERRRERERERRNSSPTLTVRHFRGDWRKKTSPLLASYPSVIHTETGHDPVFALIPDDDTPRNLG